MKKLSSLLLSALFLFAIGCGDNVIDDDLAPPRGSEVIIIPQAGQAIDALESAEKAGYTDPIFFEDAQVITAFGEMEWAAEAKELPGIEDILPAVDGEPVRPDFPVEPRSTDDLQGQAINSSGMPGMER